MYLPLGIVHRVVVGKLIAKSQSSVYSARIRVVFFLAPVNAVAGISTRCQGLAYSSPPRFHAIALASDKVSIVEAAAVCCGAAGERAVLLISRHCASFTTVSWQASPRQARLWDARGSSVA